MVFKKGYIPWNRGLTKETNEIIRKGARKLSKALKGKPKSKEAVRKVSETKKRLYKEGKLVPWNKGKKIGKNIKSSETFKRLYKEGKIKSWNKGIPRREETKRKSSETNKRLYKEGKRIPYWKGKTHTKKTKRKIGKASKERFKNPGYQRHQSKISKELWKNPEYQKKMAKSLNIKPTNPEKFLINFIKQHNLSFKYTGDFSVWIEGKNPDFIECNGKKLIIEFNGYYKHNEQEEIERAKIFSELGFRTLFLHYPDLKDETELLNKILEFCGSENK